MAETDEGRSLQEIENDPWGDPPADATRLISTALHISQQVGLDTLVPLALDHVERNPLAEGDFYPGDFLDALMRRAREEQRIRVRAVAGSLDPDETLDVLYSRAAPFLDR